MAGTAARLAIRGFLNRRIRGIRRRVQEKCAREDGQMREDLIDGEPQPAADSFKLANETYAILGACFAVYKDKGCGFLEPVYQECLEIELAARGIPFVAQPELRLTYRGRPLKQVYIADFICYGTVLVELKSVRTID